MIQLVNASKLVKIFFIQATIPPVPSAHSGHKREYLVEVLIIGDSYTGKTALFNRYVHDSYCQTGITVEFLNSIVFIFIFISSFYRLVLILH
jgi:GTPase SAR1 family protein